MPVRICWRRFGRYCPPIKDPTDEQSKSAPAVFCLTARFPKTVRRRPGGGRAIRRHLARSYAGENNTIKIALVGCGGRGPGAGAQPSPPPGPTNFRPWPILSPRLEASLMSLPKKSAKQVRCPRSGNSSGWTATRRRSIAGAEGDLVILATPPAFRPIHFEYAVAKGLQRLYGKIVCRRCPRRAPHL